MTGEDRSFGSRLVACRLSAGLSQQEVAERSGLSVRTIGGLERGSTRWPHPDSVHRLADALGLCETARDDFIRAADRRLAWKAPGAVAGQPGGTGRDDAWRITPRQLPAAVPAFAGRRQELTALTRMLSRPGGTLITISGMAGAGKTALVLHWAHRIANQFPDGQLYADLRGFSPASTPADPAVVIASFLSALGFPAGRVLPGLDDAAALYRSALAGRRMLVVLDNAADEQQVRPLLPGSPGNAALITSRVRLTSLTALEGACPLELDVLPPADARELLIRRIGIERAAAEPQAVAELTAACARLPLALAVTAARAASRPGIPLADLAAELRDGGMPSRLDALEAGDAAGSVRTAFSISYRHLSRAAARMFWLLGVHPGPDISVSAAASLTGTELAEARELLAELTRAHLLSEHAPGRYAMHDLLRDFAAVQGPAADSGGELRAALTRFLYLLRDYREADVHLGHALSPAGHPGDRADQAQRHYARAR